jgi:two-component system response regulator CpxR
MRPRKTILLVDDNETSARIRSYLLTIKGYVVTVAPTAAEAVRIFKDHPFDLIVAELMLFPMCANEMVKRMKRISKETPILIVSESLETYPLDLLADGFLPKRTCSPVAVVERVRTLIVRKRGPKPAAQMTQRRREASAGAKQVSRGI